MSLEITTWPFKEDVTSPEANRIVHVEADIITSVRLPGEDPILHRNYTPGENDTFTSIAFPEEQAQRIAEFFKQYMADAPPCDYDCHSFIGYILGWDDKADAQNTARRVHEYGEPVSTEGLEIGRPYLALAASGVIKHGLLGVKPSQNLSVMGRNSLLFLMENTTTLDVYSAKELRQVTDFSYAKD